MRTQVSSSFQKKVSLVGIINATPDSFSDGDRHRTLEALWKQAATMVEEGASLIDIGGDSTRPGSICTGPEIEWMRIEPIITALSKKAPFSVDTHHCKVAERALDLGAVMINDVSGGSEAMFRLAVRYEASVVVMYSRCTKPHHFDRPKPGDLISAIADFFNGRVEMAQRCGLPREKLLFDPGMGAFLSADPVDSFRLIKEIDRLSEYSPLYVGISRKGFLKKIADEPASERDASSALLTSILLRNAGSMQHLYVRSHTIGFLKQFISAEPS